MTCPHVPSLKMKGLCGHDLCLCFKLGGTSDQRWQATWIDGPRWQTKRLWAGKLTLLGSNRVLFVQEEIGLTNVAGAKTYFFPLAKPLPKVYFYVPRNSSLFVLLRLRLLVSFWTSSWRIRLFADGAAGGVLQCNPAIFTSKMIKLSRGCLLKFSRVNQL